jgi:multidrug efflux pump subunit AcrA (membrane-fusion protein)
VRPGAPLARLYSADLLALQRDYLNAAAQAAVQAARLSRDEGLFKDGIIAASRMMDTRATEVEAATALQEHRQLLLQAGMSDASIAALKTAAQMSPRITIVARSAGTVLEQGVAVGGRVQSGDTLFRIGATGGLALELQATRADAARLRIGDPIAVDGCAATGRITALGSQVDPVTQMVLVRAQVNGTDPCLRTNEYVRVSATPSRESAGAVSVASAAIARIGKQDVVFVRGPDGFQPLAVTVIQSQGERSWVRAAALPAGTLVVTRGVAALKGHLQGLGASAAAAGP